MTFDEKYFNLGYLDALSYRDTFVHRLDPRVKLVVTLFFAVMVVSFPKYELSGLIPFFVLPALFFALGDIPVSFILRKVVIVSPFAVFIGIFNPLLDTGQMYAVLGMPVSGGWVSFLSILLKFALTITTALLLIATTSFPRICHGMRRLGIPEVFVSQLLFLYRYMFVLAEESMRIARGRDLRSFGNRGRDMKTFARIVGVVFVRTVERAERIYQAMLARGFSGELYSLRKTALRPADVLFFCAALLCLVLFRRYDVTAMLGAFITGAGR